MLYELKVTWIKLYKTVLGLIAYRAIRWSSKTIFVLWRVPLASIAGSWLAGIKSIVPWGVCCLCLPAVDQHASLVCLCLCVCSMFLRQQFEFDKPGMQPADVDHCGDILTSTDSHCSSCCSCCCWLQWSRLPHHDGLGSGQWSSSDHHSCRFYTAREGRLVQWYLAS